MTSNEDEEPSDPSTDPEQRAFADRLSLVAEEFGGGAGLARAIGRSQTGVRKWLKDGVQPTAADLRKICAASKVRLEWLVLGTGPQKSFAGVGETPAAYGLDPTEWFRRDTVIRVVSTLEEELSRSGKVPSPTKRADLVAALCMIFQTPEAVQRPAIQILIGTVE